MEIKFFEVRDRATFIPVMTVHIGGECTDQENWLMRKAGYGQNTNERDYVYLTNLETGNSTYDAYKWTDRTIHEAHKYIQSNWENLQTGDVVDVEYILGETTTCKGTERWDI